MDFEKIHPFINELANNGMNFSKSSYIKLVNGF